ncbi:IS4 transposase [Ureibacillus thermosphaericus]|uniref:IS4 transposase n=1 Tax=Ureibacillus thermosphaericus TaxID=51173 RepID=A0A840Q0Z6_URETH|nr:IS4 transposase [Ureibacillus thermosphaericus]
MVVNHPNPIQRTKPWISLHEKHHLKNAVVRVLERFSLPEDSPVFSDEMVVIGTTQNRSENAFRPIKLLDTKGNELHLRTNRFDMYADEIAEIYQSRWAIELFSNG